MVVGADAHEFPLRKLVGRFRQWPQRRPVELLEQLLPAQPEAALGPRVEVLQRAADRAVGLGQREERQVAQPAEDEVLGDAYAG